MTVDELTRQFHISTKTVARWRQQRLVSRRVLIDGRKRLGFLQSSVDRFVALNENRVSTYASWTLMKNFARTIPTTFRDRSHFCTSQSEMFSTVADARADHYEQESAQIQRESHVQGILKRLDKRERQIVTSRFGLARGQELLTLKQVGAAMDVTKERVRQIQWRAMNKLIRAAEEDRIEAPDEKQADRVFRAGSANPLAFPIPRLTIIAWRSTNNLSVAPLEIDSQSSDD